MLSLATYTTWSELVRGQPRIKPGSDQGTTSSKCASTHLIPRNSWSDLTGRGRSRAKLPFGRKGESEAMFGCFVILRWSRLVGSYPPFGMIFRQKVGKFLHPQTLEGSL